MLFSNTVVSEEAVLSVHGTEKLLVPKSRHRRRRYETRKIGEKTSIKRRMGEYK